MSVLQALFKSRGSSAFTDDRGKTWTATGSAATVSSPSKFGGGALDLSASSGDSLLTASGLSDFAFPGTFTIDFWLYWSGNAGILFAGSGTSALGAKVNANGSLTASEFGVADFLTTTAGDVTANTWNFISISRDGSNFVRFHVNGTNVGGTTQSTNFATPGSFDLGGYNSGASENSGIYLDDFRTTKGVTRYGASNYTAPTAEAPVGGGDPSWANVVSLLRFNA